MNAVTDRFYSPRELIKSLVETTTKFKEVPFSGKYQNNQMIVNMNGSKDKTWPYFRYRLNPSSIRTVDQIICSSKTWDDGRRVRCN